MEDARRHLPAVHALLESDAVQSLLARAPRSAVVDAVRATVDAARRDPAHAPVDLAGWASAVAVQLADRERPSLRPVLNGTGVVLHTNLGRAPLAESALRAVREVAAGFSNLEYDLELGTRGSRYTHCAELLRAMTGAEDAMVVNNCAAALLLALNTLADGGDALVSRGELVEIGGSFRVPDIMARSGARLVEVGTTNRTHLDDYRRAITPTTRAIVKVHRSNFSMTGFVSDVSPAELAALAREHGLALLHDFGGGLLIPLDAQGLVGEPTARDCVAAHGTLVVMSGDKMLGGPQAGIVVGERSAVEQLRRNPLARALRVDKLTLAALEATLALYRDPSVAVRTIPILAMLTAPIDEIRERAIRLRDTLARANIPAAVRDTEASVGGGAFPAARIPSAAVAFGGAAAEVERRLRAATPPVVARIESGSALVDLRAILPADDERLATAIAGALG